MTAAAWARRTGIIGPSFAADEIPGVITRLIEVYVRDRADDERFIDTVRRLGVPPFKAHVYGQRADKEAAGV